MKSYYAINYPCGIASHANTGKRFGTYYKFRTRATRDEWVENGGGYRTSPNYRETIPSSDSELRAELRKDADPYQYANMIDGDQDLAEQAEVERQWEEEIKIQTARS
jgi:hypothetical protein